MSMAENNIQREAWVVVSDKKTVKKRHPQVKALLEKINSRADNKSFMCNLSLRLLRLDDCETMKLWNFCANQNMDKLDRTMMVLISGKVFTNEEIKSNLEKEKPLPFIDEMVNNMEGIPAYGQDFDCDHENWGMYCQANKTAFDEKRNQKIRIIKR